MIDPQRADYSDTPVSASRPVYHYTPVDPAAAPCVSIITPYYNTGPVFYETAHSILAQSLQQWEWLIINDGSGDPESLRILDEFRALDVRIRVIDHPSNCGLSAARNSGFQQARSAFVAQLDSDDLLEPTALEKWAWGLLSHPEYAFIKGYSVGFGAQEYTWTHGFHDNELFLSENPVNATSMIRKSTHSEVDGYAENKLGGLEDWDFWLNCAAHGLWGGTIPEYHDWYRLRPNHRQRWADWNQERIETFLVEARQNYPSLWQNGFPRFLDRSGEPLAAIPLGSPFHNRLEKEKKRLLLLIPWLQTGGADKMNLDLVAGLIGRGWEVSIITTLHGDHSWAPVFEKITPDVFILANFLQPVDYPRFIKYFIESRTIDLVLISNSGFSYLALPFLTADLPQTTWMSLCHMELENGIFGAYPEQVINQQAYLDLNLTVSEHLKQAMLEHGLQAGSVEVLYANIDPEPWKQAAITRPNKRAELLVPTDTPLILFSARLGSQKQPPVFIEALRLLYETGQDFKAVVIGDGPDKAWMMQTAAQVGLAEQVIFLGALPAEAMPAYFAAADIFFLPSQWEGIAITVYEAMAAGLVVVGADVGGQDELVTNETGFLIERSTPAEEAHAYTAILGKLIQDPALRQRMGAAGQERIRAHFRRDQMLERFDALAEQARRRAKGRGRPPIDEETAVQSALDAAEFARAVRTWQQPVSTPQAINELEYIYDPLSAETGIYRRFKRLGMPVYRWAKVHGWNFIDPFKEKLRSWINRKSP